MTTRIGAKIRQRRTELHLSQDAVAIRSKVSRAHLTRIEGGLIDPRMDTVERIARALKTSPAALLAA